jgi:hypothetical protein
MHQVLISRGFLVLCEACLTILKDEKMIDSAGRATSDDIIHELCPNCHDYNKPLIDDILGSAE